MDLRILWFFFLEKSIDNWTIYYFYKSLPLRTPQTPFFIKKIYLINHFYLGQGTPIPNLRIIQSFFIDIVFFLNGPIMTP